MKKLIFSAVALATVMLTGACQKEIDFLAGDTNVTFTVSTGEIATKADIADGTNIDILYWELYGANPASEAGPLGEGEVRDSDGNKEFTVSLKLVADQDYNIVFWAQVDGKNHYVVDDLRSVKINTYSDEKANDETRAAFFAVYSFHTENGAQIKQTVYLKRPFSQLNLGATTYETSLNKVNGGNIIVNSTEVTVTSIANSFNTLSGLGEVDLTTDPTFTGVVTFDEAATPNGAADQTSQILEVNDQTYYWLGMNYLIVTGDSDNVVVDMTVVTNMGTIQHTVDNVPIKENYRTNILGNLLTTGAVFKVVVDENFDGDYMGEPFSEIPSFDTTTNTWSITNADELKFVTYGGTSFEGQTVKLTSDIDLKNIVWTPAGTVDAPFKGTFDGNNCKISNLTVENVDYAALFAYTGEGTIIKNLTLENVKINSNKHAAGVVCVAEEGLVLEGITVSGEITAASYAGGIMHNGANATIKNCVNNADITANRAGGIASWVTVGANIENVVNNGNVTASVGGAGIAHGFAGTIRNAVNNGNVTSAHYEAAGGVVGVQKAASTYEYCYNYGNVTSTYDDVNASAAGILGQSAGTASTIKYCANYGDITAVNSYAAGIAYSLYGTINASYCYNSGEVSGADGAGAIAPKAAYGAGDKAAYCLNSGLIESSNGAVYQGSNNNTSNFYYSNDTILSVKDNTEVTAEDALALLNGGDDTDFFAIDGGKIIVSAN